MSSRNRWLEDDLDRLIRRSLVEGFGDEEPPARVWKRIHTQLTQPQKRSTLRWSGPILQVALVCVIIILGSTVVGRDHRPGPSVVIPAQQASTTMAAPAIDGETVSPRPAQVASLALYGNNRPITFARGPEITMDAVETVFLQKHASAQPRTMAREPRRPSPAKGADIPPDDPMSRPAKMLFLRALRAGDQARRKALPIAQPTFRTAMLTWQ